MVDMLIILYSSIQNSIDKQTFIDKILDKNLLNKRLNEQVKPGLLIVGQDKIKLTKKGSYMASIYYYTNKLF